MNLFFIGFRFTFILEAFDLLISVLMLALVTKSATPYPSRRCYGLYQGNNRVLVVEGDQLQFTEIHDALVEFGKQIGVIDSCSVGAFRLLARGAESVIFDIDFFPNPSIAIRVLRMALNSGDIHHLVLITDGSALSELSDLISDRRARVLLKPFGNQDLVNAIFNQKCVC